MTPSASSHKQQAIAAHSEQAQEFEDSYRSFADDPYRDCFAYSRHRLEATLRRVLPPRGDGLRLLDVGCGTGHHLARLRLQGFEVAGMDGSQAMLERARRNNPGVDLRLGDVEQLPFEDASFDLAVCIEVLRYLPSPEPCLREARRVLRQNGILLVTAAPLFNANGYFFVNRLAGFLPTRSLVQLRQFFVTSGGLRKALEVSGFTEVRVQGVYGGPINWIERIVPAMLPQALKAWEPIDEKLADAPILRELSNMFLAIGRKAAP